MTGDNGDYPRVIARPPLLYLGALLLGLLLNYLWPARIVSEGVRYPGVVAVIVPGVLVIAAAMREFRLAGTNVETYRPATALVTGGPYRFSRNPIYLGLALIYAGIGLAANSLWTMVLLIPLLAIIRYGVIAREEAYLERKFGEKYVHYKASVRRWFQILPFGRAN